MCNITYTVLVQMQRSQRMKKKQQLHMSVSRYNNLLKLKLGKFYQNKKIHCYNITNAHTSPHFMFLYLSLSLT
jgi:hypothetical protein